MILLTVGIGQKDVFVRDGGAELPPHDRKSSIDDAAQRLSNQTFSCSRLTLMLAGVG